MCGTNVDTDALVRKYEPLIHSVIAKKLPDYVGDEDLIQVGRIALWKGARRFDPDKGKFSTYAFKLIYHHMIDELRKRKNEVSLNTPVVSDEACELQDLIQDLKQPIDGAELRFELEDFYKTLNPRRQEILRRKANGQTRKEIAEGVGISFELVKKELQFINKRWKEFHNRLEEENE